MISSYSIYYQKDSKNRTNIWLSEIIVVTLHQNKKNNAKIHLIIDCHLNDADSENTAHDKNREAEGC